MPELEIGDIAPRFRLPCIGAGPVDIGADDVAGNPILLVFTASLTDPVAMQELAELQAARPALDALGARIFVIVSARSEATDGMTFPVLADPERRVSTAYDAPAADVAIVVLRPNGHVQAILRDREPSRASRAVAAVAGLAANREPVRMAPHPPVLLLPDVLTREECRRLIATYQFEGRTFIEPGHMVKEPTHDYKMRIPEYGRRDRVDHWIVNEATIRFINERFQRRLIPELHKAFQYRVTRHERYRIGGYEGERGGELHGHRDNSEPRGAHRRFAVSVNLNAEEFEGGELVFPEYGGHRYAPRTGEALAFSCSILHEPLHVTKGKRLVLLGFLYGEH